MFKRTVIALATTVIVGIGLMPMLATQAVAMDCPRAGCTPPPPPPPPPPPDNGSNKPLAEGAEFDQSEDIHHPKLLVSCRVQGESEDTSAVRFRNIGDATIPQGSRIQWVIKKTKQGGEFLLPNNLPAGKELSVTGLLKSATPTDARCGSKLAT